MRKVRYSVAASLDGFIAGPQGEADWIPMDPEFDFNEIYMQFDTALMGRLTYEAAVRMGGFPLPGIETVVFSRTLRPEQHPQVRVVGDEVEKTVNELRDAEGKDIWLFGGGSLFRSLADVGVVDTVEIAVAPILLGEGIPVYPGPASQIQLELLNQKTYESGIVTLEYAVAPRSAGGSPR